MIKLVPAASATSVCGALALALLAAVGAATLPGCGKKKGAPPTPPAAVTGAATTPAVPTPTAPPATTTTAAPKAVVGGTGVAECNDFLTLLGQAIACEQLATARPALMANLANQQRRFAGWPALSDGARAAAMAEAAPQCKGGIDGMKSAMASAGCAP